MRRAPGAAIGTALGLLFLTAPASAQFLTFVSATGNDANTCFVQANPCKTLQRAINQTSAGGELRLLSSLVSNGFINKSITIEGGYNTVVGTLIVDSATAIVRFRRLNLNGVHAFQNGFDLRHAAAVHIEASSLERYTKAGILLAANIATELVISNSVIRDNDERGLFIPAQATPKIVIVNSRLENNGTGFDNFIGSGGGQASISRSIVFGNVFGVIIRQPSVVDVSDTVVAANTQAGIQTEPLNAPLTLQSCDLSNNGIGVTSTLSPARVSNCTITGNSYVGIDNSWNGGQTLTLGNNLVAGSGFADVLGNPLTPLAPE